MTTAEIKTRKLIARNNFQDDKTLVKSVFVCHLIFAILFGLCYGSAIFASYRLLICLGSAMLFFVIYMVYDWSSYLINLYLAFVYLLIFFVEFILLGVPGGLGLFDRGEVSKGILLQMLLGMLPYVYLGLRFSLVYRIIKIAYSSRLLSRYSLKR